MRLPPGERNRTDPTAATHGLPACLRVPIAASGVKAIERFVGEIVESITGRDASGSERLNALLIRSRHHAAVKDPRVKLWQDRRASEWEKRLFPDRHVWVHVDFHRYRPAALKFGINVRPVEVLDHIQNREAMRVHREILDLARIVDSTRNYRWCPYLRLCPIRADTNSIAGANQGGEGMEKSHVAEIRESLKLAVRDGHPLTGTVDAFLQAMCSDIIYADPFDLTKMLDIAPGTFTLPGVGDTLKLFYP